MKKRLNISLDDYLIEQLDYMAEKRGVNRSAYLSLLITDAFNDDVLNGRVSSDYYTDRALDPTESVNYY